MEFVYGGHTVKTVLSARRRNFKKLYLSKQQKLSAWKNLLPQSLPVELTTPDKLTRLCKHSRHQGVALETDAYPYAGIKEILASAQHSLVVLDRVTDSMNLGAILRSAAALGFEGVILPSHQSAAVTPLVQKVAVGAAESLKVGRGSNLVSFIKQAQKKGFWSVAASSRKGEPLESFAFPKKTLLVMGSEEKGLRPLIADQCDFSVSLSLQAPIESLNVSVAFALFAYQRKLANR